MAKRWVNWSAMMLSVVLALSVLGVPQVAVARDSEGVPDVVVRHAPLVYLHPQETLTPYPADIYYERSTEVRFGDDHYLQPGEDIGTRTLIGSAPAYYEYEPFRYIIYWFFYSLDRQELPLSVLTRPLLGVDTVKEHDGDWEHVVVRLDENGEPTHIAYYQHACEPRILGWDELSGHEPFGPYSGFWGDTHPIVYSALGSHASFWGPRGRLEPMGVRCPELPDQVDDIRFDAVGKGEAWKTWEGMGLMDARAEDWYDYTGLWGPPDAELLSLTPDLAPWYEYLDYSSGGRGPGMDRVRDVIPDGWDEPLAAITPEVVPPKEVPAPARVRLRADDVGSCPAGSAPACTQWHLAWSPVKGAKAYRIYAVYDWFSGGRCDVRTGQTERLFRWKVGPGTTSYSGYFAPDYVELPGERSAFGATYFVTAVDRAGRESKASSSGPHAFLDTPPCGQEVIPRPGFIEFYYQGKEYRYGGVECRSFDGTLDVTAKPLGRPADEALLYMDRYGDVKIVGWTRDGVSYGDMLVDGWSNVEPDGKVGAFLIRLPQFGTSVRGRYRCPG